MAQTTRGWRASSGDSSEASNPITPSSAGQRRSVSTAKFNHGDSSGHDVTDLHAPLLPVARDSDPVSDVSSEPHALGFTSGQIASQLVLYALVSYVAPTTITELLDNPKSLPAALTIAVTAPFAMEATKLFFNTSAALKKDFDLYWGADMAQMGILMIEALGFYYLDIGKDWSSVGFNAAISVTGIALKLLSDFVVAPYVHQHLALDHLMNQWLFPVTHSHENNAHADKWYNHLAMHGARFLILFSAMIAGSEAFGILVVGEYLVSLANLCGVTEVAAVTACFLMFNEILGGTFFMTSDWFKGVYPTYASRFLTLVVMSAVFQLLPSVLPILKDENAGFFIPFLITFLADLGVQYTVAPKIDKSANYGVAVLLSKCGLMKPPVVERIEGGEVYNPVGVGAPCLGGDGEEKA